MTREFIGRPHDFDFLVGRWNVTGRRLRQRLASECPTCGACATLVMTPPSACAWCSTS